MDLQNYLTTGDNWYLKNIQVTLVLLYKYNNYSIIQQNTSKGTSFYQSGVTRNKPLPPYDEKYCKYMQYFICLQKGHAASYCTKIITNKNSDKQSSDVKSKSSKSSKSIKKQYSKYNEASQLSY